MALSPAAVPLASIVVVTPDTCWRHHSSVGMGVDGPAAEDRETLKTQLLLCVHNFPQTLLLCVRAQLSPPFVS